MPAIRLAAPAPYELWRIDLHGLPDAAQIAELSDEERARAARFVFERDRRRHLAAHCGLRRVLAPYAGSPAAALRFDIGPYGKPRLTGDTAPSFNMSHSGEVALVVVAPAGDIGVDVEVMRELGRTLDLADRHFTPSEQAELAASPEALRPTAFLRGWTRKEACLKAVGSGLSIAPEDFEAGLAPARRRLVMPTFGLATELEVASIAAGEGLVVALARVLSEGFRIPAAAKSL